MRAVNQAPPHDAFVAAYRAGRVRLQVDRERATRLVSARLLLPFVLLPVLGVAVALALLGQWLIGALIFVLALAARHLVRASSRGYVVFRALEDACFYRELVAAQVIRIEDLEGAATRREKASPP